MRSTGNFSPEWGYLAPAPSILRTVQVVLVAIAVGATAGAAVVLSLVDHSTADGETLSVAAHAIVTSAQAAPVQAVAPVQAATAEAAPVRAITATAVPTTRATPVAAAAPPVSETKTVAANMTAAVAMPAAPVQNSVPAAPQIQAAAPVVPQPDDAAQPAPVTVTRQASNAPTDSTSDANTVAVPSQPAVAALTDTPTAAVAPALTCDIAGVDPTTGAPLTVPPKKAKHHTTGLFGRNLGSTLRHLFSARAATSYYPNRGL